MHHENYIDKWISCCLRRFFNIDCLFLIYFLFEFVLVYMFFTETAVTRTCKLMWHILKANTIAHFGRSFFSYFKLNKKTKDWISSELLHVYVHLMILTYRWHNEYRASLSHIIDLNYSKKYYYFRIQTR